MTITEPTNHAVQRPPRTFESAVTRRRKERNVLMAFLLGIPLCGLLGALLYQWMAR